MVNFVTRLKALIVDTFMLYMPLLYIITYFVVGGKEEFQSSQIAPLIAVVLYGVISSIFIAKSGQTPGKKAYSIKIVNAKDGKNLTFFRAFFRFIMFLFSATTIVGIVLIFYRKDKKTFHDLITNSIVIYDSTN